MNEDNKAIPALGRKVAGVKLYLVYAPQTVI